ncbi:MAG TPA: MFS transporter [Tepidisphaeraceae bacterium]|nr:MFS transporter [Tepidisphaeraceae bacterium]
MIHHAHNARRDSLILFATRIVRLIAYGSLSVILVLYLELAGLSQNQIGLLLFLTLVGDTVISLRLTTLADRWGRRKTLVVGAILMLLAGCVFAMTRNPLALLIAATIGVISPSGNEVGPFLSIEQAALSHVISDEKRTGIFAWYSLSGSLATAVGSLVGGQTWQILQQAGVSTLRTYQIILLFYAALGVVLAAMFMLLSAAVEIHTPADTNAIPHWSGLGESKPIILKLSALFAIDAFGGGFVVQSLVAFWFYKRFETPPSTLGEIFFYANVFAGLSHLAAARLAKRFGLINTMFFTHLPSNVLLMLVPFMSSLWLAVAVLLLRFSISQMDVPTRQSYTMAVVKPAERSAAAGITGVARTLGAAVAPLLAAPMLGTAVFFNAPFYLAGGLKIVYDLLLYRSFVHTKAPEEKSA